jgi:uroporphyrinogen III methyltransferase / synthase
MSAAGNKPSFPPRLALQGKRVLITRPRAQAGELVRRLEEQGAIPVLFPTIEIAPSEDSADLDQAIAHLSTYHWVIFTSANGVSAFWARLALLGLGPAQFDGVRVAAIGPATARALSERGVKTDFIPDEYIAEAILPGLGEVRGQRILLPRADIARRALLDELVHRGALVDEIAAYTTVPAQPGAEELRELEKGVDIATFTSSSTLRNFFSLLGERAAGLLQGVLIACIGPITAETAHSYGLEVPLTAAEYTTAGLVEALVDYYKERA